MEKIDDDKEISLEKERGKCRRVRESEFDYWKVRSRSTTKIYDKIDQLSTTISPGEVTVFE